MDREGYLKVQAQLLAIGHQMKELDVSGFIGAIDETLPSTPDQSTLDAVLYIKRLAQAATLFQDAYTTLAFAYKRPPVDPRRGLTSLHALSEKPYTKRPIPFPGSPHVPAPEPAVFEPGAFKP